MANSWTRASGVGTRLLLAFLGISGVSALLAGAAVYAFIEVGRSLARIDSRIDPILASVEVSRSVERIVTASSALSSATTEQQREQVLSGLSRETGNLQSLLNELSASEANGAHTDRLKTVEENVVQMSANLAALDADVRLRLQLIGRAKDLLQGVFDSNNEMQLLLGPKLLVHDGQVDRLIQLLSAGPATGVTGEDARALIPGLVAERAVRRVQQRLSDLADGLAQAAVTEQKQRLLLLAFQLRRKIADLEKDLQTLEARLQPVFLGHLDRLKGGVDGSNSIIRLRQDELDLIADARRLLAENGGLSAQLTAAAGQLVEANKNEVRAATASALKVQSISTGAIVALVALSLLTSILIVWRYVGRRIVGRLNLLSGAMLEIAEGGRPREVRFSGSDEIAAMGRAVEVFRQNAIERDALLAERAEAAERLEQVVEQRTSALQHRQAQLRVTFDNMGDGVAMFDSELRLAAWNRKFQQILDLPAAFFDEPRSLADLVHLLAARGEFGAGANPENELRRLADNIGRHYGYERTRPDGGILEVRHNPVPGGGVVVIYSDITERKRVEGEIRAARDAAEQALGDLKTAQASLIQAEKMASLGQLTAGIAHEIKNPLNFVNNFASLSNELLGELKDMAASALATLDADARVEVDETMEMLSGNLDKIAEHGRRADNIVKSMLAHSRGSSGERQRVDVNALVEEALNLAYHGARAQDQNFNITLERDFAGVVKPIDLVPQDLTRVFLNLIGNGFHAAHKRQKEANDPDFRPILRVLTREFGDSVEVRIRDNGTGIRPEHRDRLFQPFFTTKPTGEGTGLGLSISYDIVTQQHGGTITVDSEFGAFTEFTVRLPRPQQRTTTGRAA